MGEPMLVRDPACCDPSCAGHTWAELAAWYAIQGHQAAIDAYERLVVEAAVAFGDAKVRYAVAPRCSRERTVAAYEADTAEDALDALTAALVAERRAMEEMGQ